jgi:CRP-like cAMP-binding protein
LSAAERETLVAGGFMSRLPPPLVDAILARASVWRLEDDDILLRIGHPIEHWFGIAAGLVQVYMHQPHVQELQGMVWCPPGVWLNLYNPLTRSVSDVELRAHGPTTVAALSANDLMLLCRRFPELSREMAIANAGNLRRSFQITMAWRNASLKQRQLLWLLEQTHIPPDEAASGHHVLDLGQDSVARAHGVSRQTWCDGMKLLESEGLVRRAGKKLVIRDPSALQAAMDAEARAVEAPYMAPQRPPSLPRQADIGPRGPSAVHALRTSELERVRGGPWFASLDPALQQRILELSEVRRLPAGEQVLRADEWPDGCWLVIDGAIRMDNPRAAPPFRTMALLPPGAWHSHHDLVHDSPNVFDASTLQPTTLLWMPAAAFDALFRESLDYRLALVRLLARQWSHSSRYGSSLDWPIDFRIGGWLQMMHRYFNLGSGIGPAIAGSFVLEDVAQWLGTTRQAVSKQLKALEAQGVIRRTRQCLEVLQPDRLPQVIRRVSGSA